MKNAYNVLILSVLAPAVGLMAVACGGDDSKPGPTTGTGTGGTVTYELLDDMEAPTTGAGSFGILGNGAVMRVGGWFTYDDGSIPAGMPGAMMFDEIALPMPHLTFNGTSSTRAIHTSGGPFTGYGSGFGTNLNGDTALYDLTPYKGISYWAKSGSATASDKIIVRFGTKYTDPRGMLCAKDKTDMNYGDKTKCDDDFAVTDTLTTEWKQYTHLFSDFMQEEWGLHPPDGEVWAKYVYAIKFAQPAAKGFDIWLDDIAFTK